jgi:hypothetical protein
MGGAEYLINRNKESFIFQTQLNTLSTPVEQVATGLFLSKQTHNLNKIKTEVEKTTT